MKYLRDILEILAMIALLMVVSVLTTLAFAIRKIRNGDDYGEL